MRSPRQGGRGTVAPRERALVDSSAWIAFFSARDGNHRAADAFLRDAIGRGVALVTTNLILAEVHRLVLFRVGTKAALAALDHVRTSKHVQVIHSTRELEASARQWLTRLDDHVITLTDAVSFAVMEAERCTVALTFDHDFAVAGFPMWRG